MRAEAAKTILLPIGMIVLLSVMSRIPTTNILQGDCIPKPRVAR